MQWDTPGRGEGIAGIADIAEVADIAEIGTP